MCGEKQILDDEFFLFSSPQLLSYQYTTLTKYSKHACSLVEACIKTPYRQLRSCDIFFSYDKLFFFGGGGGGFRQPF